MNEGSNYTASKCSIPFTFSPAPWEWCAAAVASLVFLVIALRMPGGRDRSFAGLVIANLLPLISNALAYGVGRTIGVIGSSLHGASYFFVFVGGSVLVIQSRFVSDRQQWIWQLLVAVALGAVLYIIMGYYLPLSMDGSHISSIYDVYALFMALCIGAGSSVMVIAFLACGSSVSHWERLQRIAFIAPLLAVCWFALGNSLLNYITARGPLFLQMSRGPEEFSVVMCHVANLRMAVPPYLFPLITLLSALALKPQFRESLPFWTALRGNNAVGDAIEPAVMVEAPKNDAPAPIPVPTALYHPMQSPYVLQPSYGPRFHHLQGSVRLPPLDLSSYHLYDRPLAARHYVA